MRQLMVFWMCLIFLLLSISCVSSTETTNQSPDSGLQDLSRHTVEMPEYTQKDNITALALARTGFPQMAGSSVFSWVWPDGFRLDSDPVVGGWDGSVDRIPFAKLSFSSASKSYEILFGVGSLVKLGSATVKMPIVRKGSAVPIGWMEWNVTGKTAKVFDEKGQRIQ